MELEPLLTDADTVSALSAVPAAVGTLCSVIIVAFVAVELEPLLTDADTVGALGAVPAAVCMITIMIIVRVALVALELETLLTDADTVGALGAVPAAFGGQMAGRPAHGKGRGQQDQDETAADCRRHLVGVQAMANLRGRGELNRGR